MARAGPSPRNHSIPKKLNFFSISAFLVCLLFAPAKRGQPIKESMKEWKRAQLVASCLFFSSFSSWRKKREESSATRQPTSGAPRGQQPRGKPNKQLQSISLCEGDWWNCLIGSFFFNLIVVERCSPPAAYQAPQIQYISSSFSSWRWIRWKREMLNLLHVN